MIIIGHRGASRYAPEHTFASWDLALEMGVDYIEQDLQMTADGVLVVMHDDTLDRTTAGTCRGHVRSHTWDQIRQCDAGSWFNRRRPEYAREHYAQQTIQRLGDVLARYAGRARFYIETKNPKAAPGMELELIRVLADHGLRPHGTDDDRVIIQSFSSDSLRRIHHEDPDALCVRLFPRYETNWTIRRRLDGVTDFARGIGPDFRDVDARLVDAAHDRGLVVHPYTVNDEFQMRRLIAAGVDGMFTDVPDVLARVRAEPVA